jgi:DNA-binding winged helix-turn-helix (wHTH) protein
MMVADNRVLRIGAWRVDPALDEISRDGATVKLEPRAMRVLLCLADHAGQVVSVGQLLDAVWKDVIVTPDSVYQAVAGLRRALGDTSKEPAYIANVLRRGYRLVAAVAAWNDAATASNPEERPAEAPVSVSVIPSTTHSRVWLWGGPCLGRGIGNRISHCSESVAVETGHDRRPGKQRGDCRCQRSIGRRAALRRYERQ